MRRVGFSLVGAALVLILIGLGLGLTRRPDDKALVRQAILEATKAAREGRPGGVLDNISAEATLNGQGAGSQRQIVEAVRKFRPDVALKEADPTIIGDEARVTTSGTVTLGILNATRTFDLSRATVVLTKEADRTFFVIPSHRWRVTRVEIPDEVAASLVGQLTSGISF